ncbi:MAG: UvrD-helicase domain-containing protein [Telluria sp.]
MTEVLLANPAEIASEQALTAMFACLDSGESFLLEAGAGAGKTYSLVKALKYIVSRDQFKLPKNQQKVACITFTNVAKNEIEARTDRSPLIFCDTTHAFCWSVISGFQKQLLKELPNLKSWPEKIEEAGGSIDGKTIEYNLGYRAINDENITLHHDDVLPLTIALLKNNKFRKILTDKYPIILIDEYQDTNIDWIEAIKENFLTDASGPQFGFFGDHWQKIYGGGCGRIQHPGLVQIGKGANFRSVQTIVESLNRMRPDLPQMAEDAASVGSVQVFHTNEWKGERQTGNHWNGDLPSDVAHTTLSTVMEKLTGENWDFTPGITKILMLTHRVLADEQGYKSLPGIFRYNEAFTKKENKHIAFFVDELEPAYTAYEAKQFGAMFAALGSRVPKIAAQSDKAKWSESMKTIGALRASGTVGDMIDYLRDVRVPRLPDAVEKKERERETFNAETDGEIPRSLTEIHELRAVLYSEIIALSRYLNGYSPFETKHGVKGAEFENVLVVVGRGWNQYNFNEMLELAADQENIPAKRIDAFERNRNLFYVACSRPKKRLAILFTQQLTDPALSVLGKWFGTESVKSLSF